MAKALFILMPQYQDTEFLQPYTILNDAGHTVDVAGLEPGSLTGSKGHEHTPNLSFETMTQKDFDLYDALVIPGGPGSTKHLWGNKSVHNAITHFHNEKKLVAAICYAVIAIVETGILRNKHATVYPTDEAKAILKEYGVRFSKDGCVALTPEKIITAQGPPVAQEFGQAILNFLK